MNSADFINNLAFDYIETYSFQRGEIFEEHRKRNRAEYEKLNARKNKKNDLTSDEEIVLTHLKNLGNTQYLLNEEGKFHWSSEKTNTFFYTDPIIEKLKNILLIEALYVPMWVCAPIYRDAIVFYNKEQSIVATLNICLSCKYMETRKGNHIKADEKTYELLKEFFIEIGHEVEMNNIM